MNALELSAILLTLAAAAFGWVGVIYVALVLGVTWVFGGMCRLNDDQPTAAHAEESK